MGKVETAAVGTWEHRGVRYGIRRWDGPALAGRANVPTPAGRSVCDLRVDEAAGRDAYDPAPTVTPIAARATLVPVASPRATCASALPHRSCFCTASRRAPHRGTALRNCSRKPARSSRSSLPVMGEAIALAIPHRMRSKPKPRLFMRFWRVSRRSPLSWATRWAAASPWPPLCAILGRSPPMPPLVLESVGLGPADDNERAASARRDAANAARLRADGLAAFMEEWERLPLFATQRALPSDVRERVRRGAHVGRRRGPCPLVRACRSACHARSRGRACRPCGPARRGSSRAVCGGCLRCEVPRPCRAAGRRRALRLPRHRGGGSTTSISKSPPRSCRL